MHGVSPQRVHAGWGENALVCTVGNTHVGVVVVVVVFLTLCII